MNSQSCTAALASGRSETLRFDHVLRSPANEDEDTCMTLISTGLRVSEATTLT
jgi:hypothetical protein